MSHRVQKRARRAARAAMMTATSLPVIFNCAPAAAQQAPAAPSSTSQKAAAPDDLTEIVVTGYRQSLQSALDAKRISIQPIESVAAEDIGKMPDQNVSESLQRLPGVSINRSGGKGTQVLIDGLANNLITLNGEVLLTGREIYSSGEGSGGAGGIQYASLEGIPSEEIGGIDVIKNPTARDREGGIGGTIDLKTRSPLAQGMGLNLAGNAREIKATGAEGGATPVGTLVGGFKFNENFAVTASLSYDDEKTHDKQFQDQNRNQWLVTNTATVGSYVGSPVASTNSTLPGGQTYIDPQLGYFSDILDRIKTKGATLGAEWKWNDDVTSTFNYFYIGEEEESTTYSNKAWFSGGSGENNSPGAPASFPGIDPSKPYSIDANGVVQSATFMANGAETATLFESNKTTAHNFQFNTKFGGKGPVTGNFGLAYAKATGDYEAAQADVEHGFYGAFHGANPSIQPTAPGCNNGGNNCANGNHGYAWNWNNGGTSGLPSASYPNNYGYTDVLSNPAYTLFKSNWAWANKVDEKSYSAKFDLHYKARDVVDLTAGGRYQRREIDYVHGRYLENGVDPYGIGGVGAGTAAGNCCISTVPGQSGTYLYFQDPGYATIPYSTPQTNPNLVSIYNNFAVGNIAVKNPVTGGMTNPATYLNTVWTQAGVPNGTEKFFKDALNSYNIIEKTTAAFIMADVGELNVYHANFGVRIVRTDLTVDGGQTDPNHATWVGTASWNGVNANDVAFEKKRTYTDVLPSLNFVLDATDNQKVRFGAARVAAPQNLNDIGRGLQYGFTRATDGPNGQVRFKFNGGTSGNASLDPFRASQFNLSWEDYFAPGGLISAGYFYKAVDNFVTTSNTPTLVADGVGGSTANVSSLVNGGTGKIFGFELGAQYAFSTGFGFQANYTRSDSDSTQTSSFANRLPIPGVSKDSINAIGYYERAGFSGRLAYAWRSSAVNSSGVGSSYSFQDINGASKVYTIYSAPYGQLDGQVGYDFNTHFGIVASAVNLTNAKQHTYLQWKDEPFTYDDTGRRFFFGVKGKL
ncbi:MAG: TonB-dependent receptor [Pseudomonadota bacterium]|nr:TonB-dependent receptor [Pseudomonadota bacterium]